MSDAPPFVTIVAISDGASPALVALVASVSAQDPGTVEMVAVAPGDKLALRVNQAVGASEAEFVAVIHPVGALLPGAIAAVRTRASERPATDLLYGNEMVPVAESRAASLLKPVFSPERLRCQNYLGELVFYRRSLFNSVGGLDPSRRGAELYDLALRATRMAGSVEHLAVDLFARNVSSEPLLDSEALESTRAALLAHLEETGGGEVRSVGADGVHDTRRLVSGEPLVSIVIPTRGQYVQVDGVQRCFVVDAVRSIRELSTWQNYEIVLVVDSVAEQRVVDELIAIGGPRLRFVVWSRPFNFSEKVNLGALYSDGEYVLLLNDDVLVITPDWIEAMLALAQRPGAGMVGAMLYYGDETIQHAGHHYDGGEVSHIGLDAPRGDAGPQDGYRVEREVAGVTAACALMPTRVFREVGGLTNLLPGNFNDVDLCLKTTWQEHEIYWTPHAELYHFESKTRDTSVHAFEIDVAWRRWGFRIKDSYWPHAVNRSVTQSALDGLLTVQIRELSIPGSWEITPRHFPDWRGTLLEWYRFDTLSEGVGHPLDLRQANASASGKGVVRGIHLADVPRGQAKQVTVAIGASIDIRVGSPTFGSWDPVLPDDVDRKAVYLAEGLAHCFVALEDRTVVNYLVSDVSDVSNAGQEHGIDPLDEEMALVFPDEPGSSFCPPRTPKRRRHRPSRIHQAVGRARNGK